MFERSEKTPISQNTYSVNSDSMFRSNDYFMNDHLVILQISKARKNNL